MADQITEYSSGSLALVVMLLTRLVPPGTDPINSFDDQLTLYIAKLKNDPKYSSLEWQALRQKLEDVKGLRDTGATASIDGGPEEPLKDLMDSAHIAIMKLLKGLDSKHLWGECNSGTSLAQVEYIFAFDPFADTGGTNLGNLGGGGDTDPGEINV